MSQSQSQPQKRGMADFFKPYTSSGSAKRPSPSPTPAPDDNSGHDRSPKKAKKEPKTPVTAARFTDLGVSPFRSPFAKGQTPKLAIRSPRPKEHGTPSSVRSELFSSPLRNPPTPLKAPITFTLSDLLASERTIVKDGALVGVKDSDEDDSDSLESLRDIFGRPQHESTSSSSPPEDDTQKENVRPSILGVFNKRERQAIVGKERLRGILAKDKQHKFDISKLIDDHLEDTETKDKLDQANAYYEASERQTGPNSRQSGDDQTLLRNIIDDKGGDQDEVARVLGAMERTGALTSEKSFSLFDDRGWRDWASEKPAKHKFPDEDLSPDFSSLRKNESRERAYLFGHVRDWAIDGDIPDSVLKWTFESIAVEDRDDLREAYTKCITGVSRHWTRTNLSAQNIHDTFTTLGVNSDAIRDEIEIIPTRKPVSSNRRHDPKYLLSVLDVCNSIADNLDFESLNKLSSILTRLSLDEEVMAAGEISAAVENLISTLLELPNHQSRHHVAEHILISMYQTLKDNHLQSKLLLHILPTSPLAVRLRIALAQVFLLPERIPSLDLTTPPTISLPTLLQHLRSPAFDVSRRSTDDPVDYIELSALTYILDTALSDGGRPATFTSSTEEKTFNQQVDALADRVNAIVSSIADTGASHMRRTEAKEALGVLHKRLLYSVRTRQRPKKSVFGGRDGKEYRSEQRSKSAMQSYLTSKGKMAAKERSIDAVLGSQQSDDEKQIRSQLGLTN